MPSESATTINLGSKNYDLWHTFRNLHNFTEAGRRALNQAVYAALAPGGANGMFDHTRRHIEEDEPENWRRMDPAQTIHKT
jgi:predicted methyltransferase